MKFTDMHQKLGVVPDITIFVIQEKYNVPRLARVLKLFYDSVTNEEAKIIIQEESGLIEVVDMKQDNWLDRFSTLHSHQDTVRDGSVCHFLHSYCKGNITWAKDALMYWGITKVCVNNNYENIISLDDYLSWLKSDIIDKGFDYWIAPTYNKQR